MGTATLLKKRPWCSAVRPVQLPLIRCYFYAWWDNNHFIPLAPRKGGCKHVGVGERTERLDAGVIGGPLFQAH